MACHLLAHARHHQFRACRHGCSLPVGFAILAIEGRAGIVGRLYRIVYRQSERVAELVVEYAAAVVQLGKTQTEPLHLQFVSGDVVLERHALLLLLGNVVDELLGERDVVLYHPLAVCGLHQVQILAQSDEALVLQIESQLGPSLVGTQLCQTDACIDGSAGIDGLAGIYHQLVAEVGRMEAMHMGKVAVGEHCIADIAGRDLGSHIGQTLAAGCPDTLVGSCHSSLARADGAVVLVYQSKHVSDGHPVLILSMSVGRNGDTHGYRIE